MKKILRIKLNKGFTLIELLIYSGILTILIGVLATLFATILDARLQSSSFSTLQQDGNYMLSRISYDIKRASSISNPSAVGSTSGTLQLLINDSNGPLYTYSMDGSGNLQLTNGLGTNQINGYDTSVSGFQAEKLGSATQYSYQISFTLTSRINRKSGVETRNYQTTIDLRNN